jgi:hypothetical protein
MSFFFQVFSSSLHLHLPIFFLSAFVAFLWHWFSWFLFFMHFSSPSFLTCSMFFSYNIIYATHSIFFLCNFFNNFSFFLSKVFHCSFPLFLDFFHCVWSEAHFHFIVYHNLSIVRLKAFLVLLVFYSSILFLFYF